MKRTLFTLATALLFALTLNAESSVWKVTRGGKTLYIGGTCHFLRASDLPLPPEFDAAFAEAKSVCFETNIEKLQSPETQQLLMSQAMFTDGSTLASVLSPEAWEATQKWCAKSGLPAAQMQAFKPWMLMMTIVAIETQKLGFTPEGVDAIFQKKAVAAKKPVRELETAEEQIAFITALGEGQESELIVATLRDIARVPSILNEMVAAWRAGDLPKIDKLLSEEMRTKYPGIYIALIVRRNKAWLPKIEAMLATEPKELILVGVAHLAGKDSVLEALKKKGCTVEPVIVPAVP